MFNFDFKAIKKSKNTTWIGVSALVILIVAMVFVYLGKATLSEVGMFLGPVSMFILFIFGLQSKDADVSGYHGSKPNKHDNNSEY